MIGIGIFPVHILRLLTAVHTGFSVNIQTCMLFCIFVYFYHCLLDNDFNLTELWEIQSVLCSQLEATVLQG